MIIKEERVWRLGQAKRKEYGGWARKEEGVLRLRQEKKKESEVGRKKFGSARHEKGRSLEVGTRKEE